VEADGTAPSPTYEPQNTPARAAIRSLAWTPPGASSLAGRVSFLGSPAALCAGGASQSLCIPQVEGRDRRTWVQVPRRNRAWVYSQTRMPPLGRAKVARFSQLLAYPATANRRPPPYTVGDTAGNGPGRGGNYRLQRDTRLTLGWAGLFEGRRSERTQIPFSRIRICRGGIKQLHCPP